MNQIVMPLIVLLLYALATGLQSRNLYHPRSYLTCSVLLLSVLAIGLHGYLLHLWIDVPLGQNLSYLNVVSLVLWLVALLTLLTLIRLPVLNLILFIFPLTCLSILAIVLFPSNYILNTGNHPLQLLHILLSIIAFSFLCIAALQAMFLLIQEHSLRVKQTGLVQVLPPLQTMEAFLFQTIWIGFVLLTLVLITALIFFHAIFTLALLPKTLLTLFSWFVYAVLLLGRYIAGWRGKIAIRGTLLGFALLILAYFCTRLIL